MKRILSLAAAVYAMAAPAFAAEGATDEEIAKIQSLADQARAAPVSETVKSLFKADLDFAADARKRHVSDAFADRFLADGKMFPDSRPLVIGPDAVREALKGSKAEWYWAPVEGKADGNVGVTWGRAFLVVRGGEGAEDQTYRGRYVTVWTRDKHGDWKIWIDLGTQASPED